MSGYMHAQRGQGVKIEMQVNILIEGPTSKLF